MILLARQYVLCATQIGEMLVSREIGDDKQSVITVISLLKFHSEVGRCAVPPQGSSQA